MNIIDKSAEEISCAVNNMSLKATDVVNATLNHIVAVDGVTGTLENPTLSTGEQKKVHAFINVTEGLAYQQAKQVDEAINKGQTAGDLAGVPISVKDVFCVRDTLTTMGSRMLANFKSPYTATAVQRLINAGAIIIGKVNLDEFTYGSSCESSAFQPSPRNPWNTEFVPGGSSGGSAASVAAHEVTVSLGTDTAGSIRQPAAFCGVVGLKPTYGRVSRYGLIAFGSSLDCPGPITRNIRDAALVLQVIAGYDPHDTTSSVKDVPNYLEKLEEEVRGKKIGLSPDYFRICIPDLKTGKLHYENIQEEIKNVVLEAAQVYAELGADIVENVPMPNTAHAIPAYFVVSRVEAASNLHRFDGVKYGYCTEKPVKNLHDLYRRNRAEGFGLQPKLRILMGMYVSAAQYSSQYYQRALRVRSLIRGDFDVIFNNKGKYKLDALLSPTTPTTAFKLNSIYGDSVMMQYSDYLTVPANHAGIPAITVPAGLDKSGLPIGIQLLGSDYQEATLLQLARAYEKATCDEEWRNIKPQVLKNLEGE
jgi:aspartyl-tRNA(Asn)/glutamyl-tRNA(Gln) amidotransferase subunit A